MPSLRTIGVPLDHLVAELRAFPLASEWALQHPFTDLDPRLEGSQRRLWSATERELLTSIPGFSVDELMSLRDALWFQSPRSTGSTAPLRPRPLHGYLRDLAADSLQVQGRSARPRVPVLQNANDPRLAPQVMARQAWRWLSFALPPDLISGALPELVTQVDVVSPAVARALQDDGYAETHMHLGAALDFATIWPGTLWLLARRDVSAQYFESPGAGFDSGRTLAAWLLRAALARYLLGTFLARRNRGQEFLGYLSSLRPLVAASSGSASFAILRGALAELRRGRLGDTPFVELRELYAELTGLGRLPPARSLDDWRRYDPLHRAFEDDPPSAEIGYLRRGLEYLESEPAACAAPFAELFWQTLRVRAGLYRHMVQRPLTPGLQWFVRFYERMARSRSGMPEAVRLQAAARTCGAGQGLQSLEVRTAPADTGPEILAQVRELESTARALQRSVAGSGLEIGLVYHLTKDRGCGGALWAKTHADPDLLPMSPLNQTGLRYGSYFVERRRHAEALVWVLHHFPDSVRFIRGIDVCTDELGVPNWVLAPLVRYVRQAALRAQRQVAPTAPARAPVSAPRGRRAPCGLSRFGTTVHAGEDFVHLLTGLRNLDEAIQGYELCEGDRIGHGLALGVDPGQWSKRAGRLAVLAEDRLFDLVWVWQWFSQGARAETNATRLEREIGDLSEHIFGEPLAAYQVWQLMERLGDEQALRDVSFPECRSGQFDALRREVDAARTRQRGQRSGALASHLLPFVYLTDNGVFRRSRQAVWVDPQSDLEILEIVQRELRQKVVSRALTIEVNPTSNLLIGDFGDLSHHPLWRLRPPSAAPGDSELSICIGSDDPAVFASNTREEYQWLEDAMRIAGVSDEAARRWLERTRTSGLETRFTCGPSPMPVAAEPAPRGEMPSAPL